MGADLTDARKRAWETRRQKYGPRGNNGAYRRFTSCGECDRAERMERIIVRLYADGVLSEGQASKATGLDRVLLREKADNAASWREINTGARCFDAPTGSEQRERSSYPIPTHRREQWLRKK